ncbi:F-BAR domain only protein 2-like [Halichondria panicea]|uniref:F-BAR domain only protein 2-like n=1 Tax=Halichondria panicea TaxID=6063 RepID=UPI00312B8197
MVSKFEENFWGEGNHGYEVLLQNMKAGMVASKELAEYVNQRISVEDGYCKGLSKTHKFVQHISGITLGGFAPLWEVLTEMSHQLSDIHGQFVKMLMELNKEILEYNSSQKDKLKSSMKGEIEQAQESLLAFQGTESGIQRTKKQYQQSVEHLAKAVAKQEKAADPAKPNLESRLHQAKAWMETMKSDHQTATRRQCEQVMDFQLKMKEACQKFESLEEEHLAQMSTFVIKIAKTQDTHHLRTERVYGKVNEQLDIFSVEKLLTELVSSKGTGRDRPVPYKFTALEVPGKSIPPSASAEDVTSPTHTNPRTHSKGEKGLKGFLKSKRKKNASAMASAEGGPPTEPLPEVDEEGYSIRPEHASHIGMFSGNADKQESDSDSFSDDEPENRIKKIKIKERSVDTATVDDIKASVMSLKIGSNSPGMRKATSSQSLNMFATPPSSRRESSTASNTSAQASVTSLIDIDLILSGSSVVHGIPSPLQPVSSLPPPLLGGGEDLTQTLTPWSVSSEAPKSLKPIPTPRRGSTPSNTSTASATPTLPKIVAPEPSLQQPQPSNALPSNGSSPEHIYGNIQVFKPVPKPTAAEKHKDTAVLSPLILPSPRRSSPTTPKRNGGTPSASSELRVVSPLAITTRSATASPTDAATNSKPAVPLAIAFRETCNAIFHGTDVSKCVSKVSGEVVMSFPSNYLGTLSSSEPLSFNLSNVESVERVLHNQYLLKRNEGDRYTFDMVALLSKLQTMKEKHSSPFYNVQLLKYEVKLPDPSHLPLKLVCYWKCEASVTNFRLDYTYRSAVMKTVSGDTKPLNKLSVTVPLGGAVKNALSKPNGNWNPEQSKMVWEIATVPPTQGQESSSSLHAKFDVSDGPSVPVPAGVGFECEGATLSGLNLELCGTAYKVSLLKFKCGSGKYAAEVS